jgi:uracil-DNA glycosylase family 4
MSERRAIADQITRHLEFYRDLGVRWIVPGESADTAEGMPATTGVAVVPASSVHAAATKVFAETKNMFDAVPQGKETLEEIRDDLGDCRRCKLAHSRRNIVFGTGNPRAELMFVGEAPGADEDEQGLPFVGRAGQLLTRIIEAIDMRREDVYICNILKCRPPGNRNPESDEIASCEPFLLRQIAAIRPKVICALGTFGAQTLLRTKEPISRLRGQFIEYRGAKLMATFHPAYLLRNPGEKRKVWEDVQKIRDYLRSLH